MRLNQVLCAQHIGFMFKKHWIVQGKRVLRESGAKQVLAAKGIPVVDAVEFVNKNQFTPLEPISVTGYLPKEVKYDETHKLWKRNPSYSYGDTHVLLEGVLQAQVLLKTVVVDQLPEQIEKLAEHSQFSTQSDLNMHNAILSSHLFDAEQKKLPKQKVPDRPAYNLPRNFGISDARKNRLIISKILFECERLSGHSTTVLRKIVNNVKFGITYEKDGEVITGNVNADTFISSKKPISISDAHIDAELPSLFPIKHTISMPQLHFYDADAMYPMSNGSLFINPHTIFLHYSSTNVSNLHGTQVTDSQFKSRSMMKAFTVAASSARQQFGKEIKDLPRPVVVQCVQTDGKSFYFGVFQLNTLNLDGVTGLKNLWYNGPSIDLFSECNYVSGRPILRNYNQNVLKYAYAMYKNN